MPHAQHILQGLELGTALGYIIHRWENFIVKLVKYYNTRNEDRVIGVCLPFSLCLHSVRECADDVLCLRNKGAQRYVYVDRLVAKPIKTR